MRNIPIHPIKYKEIITSFVRNKGYHMKDCSKAIPRVNQKVVKNDCNACVISAKRKMLLENAGIDTSLFIVS